MKAIDLRAVMQFPIAIVRENGSFRVHLGRGLPAIDFGEDGFHFRLAFFALRIPPIERAERFVVRVVGGLGFGDETQRELMNEPAFALTLAGRIDRFLPPLQETLSVGEGAFFLRVASKREEKE